MTDRLLQLLSTLISFQTTADKPDQIEACFEVISQELSALPFTVEEYVQNGVTSLIWRNPEPPRILLNAHLDVVPASQEMFTIRQEGDKLTGRGVMDMKFGIVSIVIALQEYFAEHHSLPPVDIMISSDEEVGGHNGVGYLVNQVPLDYDCVFIPDGGEGWHVIEETKGALQLRLKTTGKSAHGSRPWEGKSAIDALLTDLGKIRSRFPESITASWDVTLTIGQVHGGKQLNQVSDEAFAELDFRYPAHTDGTQLLSEIKELCTQSQIEVVATGVPLKVNRNHPVIEKWLSLIQGKTTDEVFMNETGATDGRYFAEKGLSVLLSQPVGGALHTEEEWLSISSLVEFTEVLRKFFTVI